MPLSSIPLPGATSGELRRADVVVHGAGDRSAIDCSSDFGIDDAADSANDNGVTLLCARSRRRAAQLDPAQLDPAQLDQPELVTAELDPAQLDQPREQSRSARSRSARSRSARSRSARSRSARSRSARSRSSSIPLSSIGDLASVVNCATYPQLCASRHARGARKPTAPSSPAPRSAISEPTATRRSAICRRAPSRAPHRSRPSAQLLAGDTTTTPGYPNLTLGDLLLSTIPPASYPWQTVHLLSACRSRPTPASAGETVTYTAGLTVSSAGSAAVQVTLSLPSTFSYVAGQRHARRERCRRILRAGSTLNWTFLLDARQPHPHVDGERRDRPRACDRDGLCRRGRLGRVLVDGARPGRRRRGARRHPRHRHRAHPGRAAVSTMATSTSATSRLQATSTTGR